MSPLLIRMVRKNWNCESEKLPFMQISLLESGQEAKGEGGGELDAYNTSSIRKPLYQFIWRIIN